MQKFKSLFLLMAIIIALSVQPVSGICPPGDFDGNCIVDIGDLQFLAQRWLYTDPSSTGTDLQDFNLLAANWQKSSPPMVINEFMASNDSVIEDPAEPGEFPDWIELHNFADYPVNISGMFLTNDLLYKTKWQIPAGQTIYPNSFLLFWADNDDEQGDRHTNFKVPAAGGSIALIDKDGQTVIDVITYKSQSTDNSYGRITDASADWVVFSKSTPAETNANGIQAVADTKFSVDRGFYFVPFNVVISSATQDAIIYYTIDGSEPTLQSSLYTAPINITTTTCIRAFAYKPGYASTNIDTQTYIFPNDVVNQPSSHQGYPEKWKSLDADYEMDPEVTADPNYAGLMTQALLSIPTLSIVTDAGNLFNPSTDPNTGGIYLNATMHGYEWERPASVEFFDSTDPAEFQVDCGLRINGGSNRNLSISPKHSFRLLFKSEYGSTKLNFPLYGPDNADEFDSLVIRGGSNFSWVHFSSYQRKKAQYIRDHWARDTQIAMGQVSPHDRYVHLYLNGIYWGMYNLTERPDGRFMSSYYGGNKEDYDVLNSGEVIEGDIEAWNRIFEIAYGGLDDPNNYAQIQQYLDIDNIIDYFILNHYNGNYDWNYNWFAGRNRLEGGTYKIFSWDAEMTFMSPTLNNLKDFRAKKPTELFQLLRKNKDFRDRFAQRVYDHFFNGGPFYVNPDNPVYTPDAPNANMPAERWMKRAQQIEQAVIAESARWGDYRRDVHQYEQAGPFDLYTRNKYWYDEQNELLTNHFPVRTGIVLEQYRQANLYPMIDAPKFSQHTSQVPSGFQLQIEAPAQGTVYYTLDGSEPRLYGTSERADIPLVSADAEKFIKTPTVYSDLYPEGKFDLYFFKANIPVVDYDSAMSVLQVGDKQDYSLQAEYDTINFNNFSTPGHFGADLPLPAADPDTDVDDFVMLAISSVLIPSPGDWTFGVRSDEGFEYWLGGETVSYSQPHLPADTLTVHNFQKAGLHFLSMIFYEHTGGAELELFAAKGNHTTFDPEAFRLIGDTAAGGLPTAGSGFWTDPGFDHSQWTSVTAQPDSSAGIGFSQDQSYDQYIAYDLQSEMLSAASSCLVRIPFTADSEEILYADKMTLKIRCDDGFVAFLNGTEIARLNAPQILAHDSTATASRTPSQALQVIEIDVTDFLDKLADGENILAVQGLNSSKDDPDFLITAELNAEMNSPEQASPTAIEYTAPIIINQSTTVKAATLGQWQWSTQNKAEYTVAP